MASYFTNRQLFLFAGPCVPLMKLPAVFFVLHFKIGPVTTLFKIKNQYLVIFKITLQLVFAIHVVLHRPFLCNLSSLRVATKQSITIQPFSIFNILFSLFRIPTPPYAPAQCPLEQLPPPRPVFSFLLQPLFEARFHQVK